jgi:CxxC motif-containing protein (DUF1111 family)
MCGLCHVPALPDSNGMAVPLYSDLLLHAMGLTLDGGVTQGSAPARSGGPPRSGAMRHRFLHDGRATTIAAAILAHDGEGAPAVEGFRQMPPEQRDALLAFLGGL